MSTATVGERLQRRLVRRGDCLEWTGYTRAFGYGQLMVDGKCVGTHRVAWTLANGPIPDGICVLHRCDNPPCCEPAHLFLGTAADNTADMIAKGRHRSPPIKSHCKRGHPYDEANTYVPPGGGRRFCRTCHRERYVPVADRILERVA